MERTHNTVALTHSWSKREFLLIAFQSESERESLHENFAESETEGNFLEIDRALCHTRSLRGRSYTSSRGRTATVHILYS